MGYVGNRRWQIGERCARRPGPASLAVKIDHTIGTPRQKVCTTALSKIRLILAQPQCKVAKWIVCIARGLTRCDRCADAMKLDAWVRWERAVNPRDLRSERIKFRLSKCVEEGGNLPGEPVVCLTHLENVMQKDATIVR